MNRHSLIPLALALISLTVVATLTACQSRVEQLTLEGYQNVIVSPQPNYICPADAPYLWTGTRGEYRRVGCIE